MKKHFFHLVVFFSFQLFTQGQVQLEKNKTNLDSILQILSKLTGTEKIDSLNSIAFRVYKDYPDSCRKLATLTIKMSDSLNYQKGLADGYRILGDGYIMQDSLIPRMINYLKAARIYEQLNPSDDLVGIYVVLSWMNFYAGRFQSAINYQKKAKRVNQILQTSENIEWRYNFIARSFMLMDEFDSAIYYNKLAVSSADTSIDPWFYNTFGRIYMRQFYDLGDTTLLEKSVEWFQKGLDYPKISDYQKAGISANLAWAYYAYEKKELNSLSMYHSKQVIPGAVKSRDAFYLIPGNWMQRGNLLKREGNYDSAIVLYNKGLEIADSALANFSSRGHSMSYYGMQEKYWLKRKKSEAYYFLYVTYSTIGNYKRALDYYVKYKNAQDEIYREETKNLVAILDANSENEKTRSRIDMLAKNNELKDLRISQSRLLNYSLAGMFTILVLFGILFIRQNKLKAEHKTVLLEQKLLRLQMNPHFIFNALSSIHSLMNPKDVNKASNFLGHFSRLLRFSLESSREDYILLEDEVCSMKNYMDLQKLRYEDMFSYHFEVDREIQLDSAIIPPMLIQPFIENAIEHGIRHKEDQGNIFIRFKLDNKKITCEIEDDGVGREKAWEVEYTKKGKHKSLATEIIRDRIKILNKKLKQKIKLNITDLKSEANEAIGTMVSLDLPYLLD